MVHSVSHPGVEYRRDMDALHAGDDLQRITSPIQHLRHETQAPTLRFIDTQASLYLDLLRGLAALVVLVSHWFPACFGDTAVLNRHLLTRIMGMPLAAGHQAVIIFFVLSGFLIGGSVFRMLERGQWDWALYGTHRLLRLWVVVIPGLLSGLFWDGLGMKLGRPAFLDIPNTAVRWNASHLTLLDFSGNVAFLQTLFVPTFGSNDVLWSLANEFWYYMLFPLICVGIWPYFSRQGLRSNTSARTTVAYLLLACILAVFVCPKVIPLFPVWLMGVVLSKCPAPRMSHGLRTLATLLYVPFFLLIGRVSTFHLTQLSRDYFLGIATFFYLLILLSSTTRASDGQWTRWVRGLSRMSFTLYIVHMPILCFLLVNVLGERFWKLDPLHVTFAMLLLAALMGYAYVLASLTEFHTDSIRRRAESLLRRTGA